MIFVHCMATSMQKSPLSLRHGYKRRPSHNARRDATWRGKFMPRHTPCNIPRTCRVHLSSPPLSPALSHLLPGVGKNLGYCLFCADTIFPTGIQPFPSTISTKLGKSSLRTNSFDPVVKEKHSGYVFVFSEHGVLGNSMVRIRFSKSNHYYLTD